MYESLFSLDSTLVAEPVLCKSWSTDDDITFTFEILPNVAMSDDSTLTADDVAYSIRQAAQTGRFANRLNTITNIETDGDLTVTISISSENSRFIRLLDIPIIKSGHIGSDIPPGTGPYLFADGHIMRLIPSIRHRDYLKLPVSVIYLRECGDNELTALFDDGALSMLWDDPSGAFDFPLNRLRETRYYETTALQYIGFNTYSAVLGDADVRRAFACAIDRQYISNEIMIPELTLPAPLAISPAFDLYDVEWEYRAVDPFVEMATLFVQAGLDDFDDDPFLELSDGIDGYIKFSINFIVNSENKYKVQAAHHIADTLRQNGININVRELPWELFIAALENGRFDMYYGEVLLGADFDLSPLLLPGSLNFGRTASTHYRDFIGDFLAARTDEGVRQAAKLLCDEITQSAPFAPILYKRYAVYSPIGVVSGAEPSQSGVFRNFHEWSVDLTMLT